MASKAGEALKEHMEKRMGAFKEGEMRSRVKHTGPVVQKKKQALAISLSEARKKGLKGAPKEKKTTKDILKSRAGGAKRG